MAVQSTTLQPGPALTKNAFVAWKRGFRAVPAAGRLVFTVASVQNKTSEHSQIDYSPIADTTPENVNYSSSNADQGDTLNLTQGKVTSSFEITQEMLKFDRYNMMRALRGMMKLGSACPERMELDLQLLLLSMGFGSSYQDKNGATVGTTSADGVSLYNHSHTVNGSASTYDNLGAIAFGQTGLEGTQDLARSFIDHQGHIVYVVFDTIFSTTKNQLVNLVYEYMNGINHIEDGDRGINSQKRYGYEHLMFHKGDFTAQSARDASKDDYWGMFSSDNREHAVLEVSGDPRMVDAGTIQRNQNVLMLTDCFYAYGILGTQWIAANNA